MKKHQKWSIIFTYEKAQKMINSQEWEPVYVFFLSLTWLAHLKVILILNGGACVFFRMHINIKREALKKGKGGAF